MELFDSHCHLTDERFAGEVDAVLQRARQGGVAAMVTIASDAPDALAAAAVAEAHPDVWSSAGIHPHVAEGADVRGQDTVRELLTHPRVVAVGETGLDYHYDNSPREVQRALFEWHLEQAAETDCPVIVHSRDADQDTIAMLRAAGSGVRGVLHCFAGGVPLLDAALELDWWVSFAGLVSFKRYESADLVRAVPDARLLVETDSPYLAPVPHRGRRNEPLHVRHVVEAVAAHRGQEPAQVAALTTANARAFYRLS
ncbi:MAG: TatD family hydrolase [Gemmatimonadota bacterium]